MQLIADAEYTRQDYTTIPLAKAEYDNCTFTNCNFESVNLAGIVFNECTFDGCNMGNAKTGGTAFKDCEFTECKLLGLNFGACDPFLFAVNFQGCQLQLASFYRMKMKGVQFMHCNLEEADFTEADITGAVFYECKLANAVFESTILEKADLRNAIGFSIDPDNNRIKKAKFSKDGLPGLLYKHNIVIE